MTSFHTHQEGFSSFRRSGGKCKYEGMLNPLHYFFIHCSYIVAMFTFQWLSFKYADMGSAKKKKKEAVFGMVLKVFKMFL